MRLGRVLLLVVLIVSGLWLDTSAVRAIGVWQRAAPYPAAQMYHDGATLLQNGQLLYTGFVLTDGTNPSRGRADRYDPAADTWRAAAPFDFRQGYSTPVLLDDGRVLVIGGSANESISPGGNFNIRNAQIYDPRADRWSPAGAMSTARGEHTATLLRDGTVLVVGGDNSSGSGPTSAVASVERYDPRTGIWSPAASLAQVRAGHTATRLADGRVLIVGGGTNDPALLRHETLATAELYDPATDRWTSLAPMSIPRGGHTMTLLRDGRVLVVGGIHDSAYQDPTSAEIYDPATNRWTVTPMITPRRIRHSAVLLADGGVLVVGGDATTAVERFDPATNRWVALPAHPEGLILGSAHALADGRVFVVGTAGVGGSALFVPEPQPAACFPETGFCVRGRFLDYWREHGGLARNGYPLTEERVEVLEDGKAYTVQYFERVRLEYQQENAAPYDVLLGQFGRRILNGDFAASRLPGEPQPGRTYFGETGHTLGGRFGEYWSANGGLAQFGFPLTEEFPQRLEDGNEYAVQYFERARFELHPEKAGTPYDVLLGQFGRRILAENNLLGTTAGAGFGLLYIGNEEAQRAVGTPAERVVRVPGATQAFERGRMYYRSDTRRIYIFCGGVSGIVLLTPQGDPSFSDTWGEGQEPGGGPAPQSGLFYPQRGFGKLWRGDQRIRDCLGYARTGDEEAYTFAAQQFQRGFMLVGAPSEGRIIYAVSIGPFGNGTGPAAVYAPYPDPSR